ncbi:uncharacterized protein F4822DRAFT_430909 [Hypoxylon trugodes]|uniref:uncharacterized protein n=1 Tax=Hypoxylon trugodes TaxID=326681 RepID=UPI00218EAA7C|nr:uncharacterized protein F4822DRAFT_430909 [Hypoxylon trugodes]KAI1388154.1 hypothetical protein F4822DRAFT_430909 [Hypoxylon trugodes]
MSHWQYDEERNKSYWADEDGRYIYAQPGRIDPYSDNISDVSTATNPEVRRYVEADLGYYKNPEYHHSEFLDLNNSRRNNTWPGLQRPSYDRLKQTGNNRPFFDTGSEQSARPDVDHPSYKTDVYRNAKRQWGRKGPSGSSYNHRYQEYKYALGDADAAREAYKSYFDSRPWIDSQELRANLDKYGGKPIQTESWHTEAEALATTAARVSWRMGHRRNEYQKDFIGYHEPSYFSGHRKQVDSCENRAANDMVNASKHSNWISKREDARRARAAEMRRRNMN